MREMKDSGVEWIGEIPTEWEICKLKNVASIQTGNTPPKNVQSTFYSDESGTPWIKAEDLGKRDPISETKEYLTEEGKKEGRIFPANTVFVCCIASIGKTGFSEQECSCNQQINGIIFNRMQWKYGYYMTLAQESEYIFNASGNVMKIINTEKQGDLWCPLPTKCDQERIVNYLDTKCSKIDGIIEKQQAIIEKLKEYKFSIITEAVTKGINLDVEMKDSTIDMCEQIPVHWGISQNRYLFSLRDEKNYKPLEEVRLLSLYTDLGVFPHGEQEERGNKAVKAEGYKVVYENDIVVNIILAWMGAIGRSAYDGVTSPAYDIYKPNEDVCSRYYHYLYRTKPFSAECYKYGHGIMAMRWRTYSSEFKSIKVPVPPYIEQCQIADYLDSKCDMLDKTIADRNKAIDKLQEYKKSLIYEVVTGKKEV